MLEGDEDNLNFLKKRSCRHDLENDVELVVAEEK